MRETRARWVAVLPLVAACAAESDRERIGSVSSPLIFEQAIRRDPTEVERSRIARIGSGFCTGFFLENTSDTTFVATALHCFDFNAESWCQTDGWLRTGDGVTDGHSDENGDGFDDAYRAGERDPNDGWCARIIAAEPTLDIVVFEADHTHPSGGDSTFRLAAYEPKVQTRGVLTGFPGDDDREGRITTTENCWLVSGVRGPATHKTFLGDHIVNAHLEHNCSSATGNSGGPLSIEGTRDVIGVHVAGAKGTAPASATDLTRANNATPTSAFVALHRAALEEAGIVLSATQDPATIRAPVTTLAGPSVPAPAPAAPKPPVPPPPTVAPFEASCAFVPPGSASKGGPLALLLAGIVLARRRLSRASR